MFKKQKGNELCTCFHCKTREGLWTEIQNVATNSQYLATSYNDPTMLQLTTCYSKEPCSTKFAHVVCLHVILILPLRIGSCEWNLQLDLFVVCGSSLLTQCKGGAPGWQFRQWSHHPQSTLSTATNSYESTACTSIIFGMVPLTGFWHGIPRIWAMTFYLDHERFNVYTDIWCFDIFWRKFLM